jgi:hypothetical protein
MLLFTTKFLVSDYIPFQPSLTPDIFPIISKDLTPYFGKAGV